MKIKNLLFTFCLFTTTFAIAQTESLKKYQIKSFVVEYKTTASGSFNGMGSVNSEGTKTLYVDNYGALEVSEKMEKTSTRMMGQELTATLANTLANKQKEASMLRQESRYRTLTTAELNTIATRKI